MSIEDQASNALPCPKCSGTMVVITLGGVQVDRCQLCRGIWFDANEVLELRREEGSESIDDGSPFIGMLKDKVTDIDCPVCQVPMAPFRPPNTQREITLELCPKCQGLFFDAGEYSDFVLDESFWNSLA